VSSPSGSIVEGERELRVEVLLRTQSRSEVAAARSFSMSRRGSGTGLVVSCEAPESIRVPRHSSSTIDGASTKSHSVVTPERSIHLWCRRRGDGQMAELVEQGLHVVLLHEAGLIRRRPEVADQNSSGPAVLYPCGIVN